MARTEGERRGGVELEHDLPAPREFEAPSGSRPFVILVVGVNGTGKTTTLRALLDLLDAHGKTTALASPTGRAAKRLAEATVAAEESLAGFRDEGRPRSASLK